MSQEADELTTAALSAANSPAAKMAGVSNALRLLVAWVLSIENRLEKMSNGNP